jgi:hypothetical protein
MKLTTSGRKHTVPDVGGDGGFKCLPRAVAADNEPFERAVLRLLNGCRGRSTTVGTAKVEKLHAGCRASDSIVS